MSSRLCIKNLPPSLSDETFHDHFAQKAGLQTRRSCAGRMGRPALRFIGYETVAQAEAASSSSTELTQACKIVVERPLLGSADIARLGRHSREASV